MKMLRSASFYRWRGAVVVMLSRLCRCQWWLFAYGDAAMHKSKICEAVSEILSERSSG